MFSSILGYITVGVMMQFSGNVDSIWDPYDGVGLKEATGASGQCWVFTEQSLGIVLHALAVVALMSNLLVSSAAGRLRSLLGLAVTTAVASGTLYPWLSWIVWDRDSPFSVFSSPFHGHGVIDLGGACRPILRATHGAACSWRDR